jgi:O-antigen ligase
MIAESAGRDSSPGVVVRLGLALLFVSIPFSISLMQAGLAVAILGALIDLTRGRRLPATPLDLPLLLFLGLTLLSALLSGDAPSGLRQFAGSWTVAGVYLMAGYGRDQVLLKKLLALLFVSAAVVAGYGIFQHFTGIDVIRPDQPLESLLFAGREVFFPRGAFSHYQTFSNVFFLLFCVSLGQATLGDSGRTRRLWVAVCFLLGLAVLLTYTRGIWLASLGALVFTALFSGRWKSSLAVACAGAVVIAFSLSSPVITSRARTIFETERNVERFLLWETTWNMIREHPRLGVGVGSFQRIQEEFVREEVVLPMSRSHSHNNLLQVTAERGLFGLFLFLWIWYVIVKEGFAVILRQRGERGFSFGLVLGSLAGMLGFFLDGLFQNNFGDTEVVMLFWLMAGLVVVQGQMLRDAGTVSA